MAVQDHVDVRPQEVFQLVGVAEVMIVVHRPADDAVMDRGDPQPTLLAVRFQAFPEPVQLALAQPAVVGVVLMASCGTSPPPSSVPVVTVSAVPTIAPATPQASAVLPTDEIPTQAATPTAIIPTSTPASVEPSPVPPTVVSPLQTATSSASVEPSLVPPTVVSPLKTPSPAASIPVCTVRVVGVFPHDRAAFTQGLVFEDGGFYEGTGLRGQSTLRRVDLENGEVLQVHSLPPEYFGEGITVWEDRIIQLTWKSGQGFVYDRGSFELLDTFQYPTEGWGITHDGARLIMSDGTQTLYFWDPETFVEIGSIDVRASVGLVTRLNELEYIQGMVLANIWQTDRIAVIDPQMGQVTAWIDLQGLLEPEDYAESVDVLNGIAYDAGSERLFVTGKLWPKLFEVELVSPSGATAPLTCK